jgi:hypothetical protein
MYLDYYDLDQGMRAHSLLRQHQLKVTFFPNKQSVAVVRGQPPPRLIHRIVVDGEDVERANELLREAGLTPPL